MLVDHYRPPGLVVLLGSTEGKEVALTVMMAVMAELLNYMVANPRAKVKMTQEVISS